MSKTLLVPTDFTEVARVALEHAVGTAKVIDGNIVLLHVVDDAGDVDKAKEKLEDEADIVRKSNAGIEVKTSVRIGNIFDDIGDAASEMEAELIFMGTHGAKGWQKVTGSHALKVITHSEVPFIVVQKKGVKENGYDDIVVPLDLHKATKQKLELVANMAKYFDSRLHLITPKETDQHLAHQLERNIYFAKNYLRDRDIEFTTHVAQKGDFDDAILAHAQSVDGDLIAIMNFQKNSLLGMGLLGSNYEQKLLTNEHEIPVLIINPVAISKAVGSVFTGSI